MTQAGEVPPVCHNSMLPLPATTGSLKVTVRLASGRDGGCTGGGLVAVMTGAAVAGTKTAAHVTGVRGLVSV